MPGTDVDLIKGGRGDFIVKAGSAVLWNKKKMGDEFPDEDVIVEKLRQVTSQAG